jgi:cytochrome c oxidase subunit III
MTPAVNDFKRFQHSVAMTVTLVSFGMLFAAMFLGYFLVRFNTAVWPPVEIEGIPQTLPALSTLVIALSSWAFYTYEKGRKTRWLWATLVLGFVFLACQWQLWSELKAAGILVSNGQVSSMVYAFTWLHAAHIVGALMTLVWLLVTPWGELKTVNVGKFWHFLGVVWLFMYLMLFLV